MGNFYDYDEDALTPYKGDRKIKKQKKGIKNTKSDHKHLYVPCLVESEISGHTHLSVGKYCSVCGRTVITRFFISVPSDNNGYRRLIMDNKEIMEMFPDYEIRKEYTK